MTESATPLSNLRPMDAVAALYHGDDAALSESILADLSQQVFHGPPALPASPAQCLMARLSLRLLKRTTRIEKTATSGIVYHNRLLERSAHPYARALLNSTSQATSGLVEGGDPMNGPYLMLAPSVRANGNRWDRIFFNSVQGKDVRIRFILETRATYEAAKSALQKGGPVRLKAVAAGTGLSLILAYDKLIREGCDPTAITAFITDRDPDNTRKTKHLLSKLSSTRDHRFICHNGYGIAARTEDAFAEPVKPEGGPERFDVVTAVGILEYFEGTTTGTTREKLGLAPDAEAFSADNLAMRLSAMTAEGGQLIVNSYRDHASIRILELFGKRFAFRGRKEVAALLGRQGFQISRNAGSAHIYDVDVFVKNPSA